MEMHAEINSTLIQCLRTMLRPVVRFCLNRSLGLRELLEAAKVVFIELAVEELKGRDEKINISRISVVTGVHRKDAVRIYREGDIQDVSTRFTSRVVNQWRRDKRFTDKGGKPRILEFEGDESEFAKLVNLVSTDLHPGTVLFDLERLGAVERTKGGLKLKVRSYMPLHNPKEGMRLMSSDTEDLMFGVIDNIFAEDEKNLPNYHGKVVYDNVAEEDIPKIRAWLFKACGALHARALAHLAKYDLDINPDSKKKGGKRIALGLFTRT